MILDRKKLKEMLKNEEIGDTEDLQRLMRGIMKDVIEALYDGEITDHLGYEKHEQKAGKDDNSRNGFSKKTVQSNIGPIDLDIPRDRNSEFSPKVIRKRQRDISGIESKVISMYAKGVSTRDIKQHISPISPGYVRSSNSSLIGYSASRATIPLLGASGRAPVPWYA